MFSFSKVFLLLAFVVLFNEQSVNGSDVVVVNSANFTDVILNSDDIWLVKFYAPWCGHCKALAPEWEKAATSLKGVVRLAKADVDADRSLGNTYGIQGFPTIKIFKPKEKKPTDYNGGRKASDIIKYARQLVPGAQQDAPNDEEVQGPPTDVIKLQEDTFEEVVMQTEQLVLVEFFAPWCGHCKSLAPEWEKAAQALKGVAKLCAVDATEQTALASRYKVDGYPTIIMFGPGKERKQSSPQFNRNADDIIEYVYTQLEAHGVRRPSLVKELTNQAALSDCVQKKYCVLLLLPHLIDTGAAERQESIDMFGRVASNFRTFPSSFMWLSAVQQPHFEEVFQLSSGYPSMLIIDHGRKRFVKHVGIFREEALVKTIRSLQNGYVKTISLEGRELPKIVTVEEWDGKEYKYE